MSKEKCIKLYLSCVTTQRKLGIAPHRGKQPEFQDILSYQIHTFYFWKNLNQLALLNVWIFHYNLKLLYGNHANYSYIFYVCCKKKYPIEFSSFNTENYNINYTRKAKDLEEKKKTQCAIFLNKIILS